MHLSTLLLACVIVATSLFYLTCDAAICSPGDAVFRKRTRSAIFLGGSPALYVLSYTNIGTEIEPASKCNVGSFILNHNLDRPVEMLLYSEKEIEYLRFYHMSIMCDRKYYLESPSKLSDLKELNEEDCIGSSSDVDVYIASLSTTESNPALTLLYTCKFWFDESENDSEISVTSSIILLFEGITNESFVERSKEILNQERIMTNIKYSFLNVEGFCACDDALNYINNCPIITSNTDFGYFIIAFLAIVVTLILCLYIWPKLQAFLQNDTSSEGDEQESQRVSSPSTLKVRPARNVFQVFHH